MNRVLIAGVFVLIAVFFCAIFGVFGDAIQMATIETIQELRSHRVVVYVR